MVPSSERLFGERKPYAYTDFELGLAQTALATLGWCEKTGPQEAIRKAGLAIAFKVNEYSREGINNGDIIEGHIDYACCMLGITVPIRGDRKKIKCA